MILGIYLGVLIFLTIFIGFENSTTYGGDEDQVGPGPILLAVLWPIMLPIILMIVFLLLLAEFGSWLSKNV